MTKAIAMTWDARKKDYVLSEDAKKKLKALPTNICRSIKEQLRNATKFTRDGLMDPLEHIEVSDESDLQKE